MHKKPAVTRKQEAPPQAGTCAKNQHYIRPQMRNDPKQPDHLPPVAKPMLLQRQGIGGDKALPFSSVDFVMDGPAGGYALSCSSPEPI
jgi:hypothetical protein